MGDAGAVFDLASKCRLGVGPASSKRWGDGWREKGEDKQPNILPPVRALGSLWLIFLPHGFALSHLRLAFMGWAKRYRTRPSRRLVSERCLSGNTVLASLT